MKSSRCPSGRPLPLKVLCVFCSTVCLLSGPPCSEGAKLRCGSELLNDLLFVCGDRGLYLGKGTWSGYGSRPRGKGIVDKCCRSNGCDLHHLEMYCAKAKKQQQTTAWPSTSTEPLTTRQTVVAYQFQAVFQKRLLQHLGPPNSPKREAYRNKTKQTFPKKTTSRRKMNRQLTTSEPPHPKMVTKRTSF
ncbi:insulin-like growth factor 3 isoform X2 [Syngnathoides biaculeatus]|nr:insulin-like growth factor 3 isoform X2 [Syngnathoides biaculeatus]XP_061697344.1 insulin-like growth factor 3 isoform X2 [Syngnathoides biaculeatus]